MSSTWHLYMCQYAPFRGTCKIPCASRHPQWPQKIVRVRTILLARCVPGFLGWRGGAPSITTTRALQRHHQMRVPLLLLGRILGIASLVIPMYPSQPFPFVQPSLHKDVRSGILDYTNPSRSTSAHHLLASEANVSLHFPRLREQENLIALQEKHAQARLQQFQKKLDKLTPVGEFSDCCSRYSFSCAIFEHGWCVHAKLHLPFCLPSRKCLTGFIPPNVLNRSREKFLNFPTRSQRKSFILNLRTPKTRYCSLLTFC